MALSFRDPRHHATSELTESRGSAATRLLFFWTEFKALHCGTVDFPAQAHPQECSSAVKIRIANRQPDPIERHALREPFRMQCRSPQRPEEQPSPKATKIVGRHH